MDPQAIFENFRRTITDHYFDMNGRVGRAQFWYFILASLVIAIVVAILQSLTFLPLVLIYNLAILLPACSIGARRLQDTGRDGRLVLIFLIASFAWTVAALVGLVSSFFLGGFLSFLLFGWFAWLLHVVLVITGLALLWFWCQPGDPGPNAYGPPPPGFDPAVRPAT
jgi:uncharacterized membrane protein YhaH (DUF805 family)